MFKNLFILISFTLLNIRKVRKRFFCKLYQFRFKSVGENIIFDPDSVFSFKTIEMGSNIYIGPGAYFSSSHSFIKICSNVMFGPNVLLLGGNHKIDVIGEYMFNVEEKDEFTDAPIIVESDVWIGANVVVLKGVTVAEGCVIGAGSVLTKSTKPYSIYAGNPARFIRSRFTDADVIIHKSRLKKDE